MEIFKKFMSYYKPYTKLFVIDNSSAIIMSLIDIALPLIIKFMLYDVFSSGDKDFIVSSTITVCVGLLILYFVRMICNYIVTYYGHKMGIMMEADMRQKIFNKYPSFSFSYFDDNETGKMASRVIYDLHDIGELAHHGPENIIISAIKLLGSLAILFSINVTITLVLSAIVVFMLIFSRILNTKMKKEQNLSKTVIAEINATIQDSLSGIRVVKSFNNEKFEKKRFGKNNKKFVEARAMYFKTMGRYTAGNDFMQGFMYIVVFGVGAILVANQKVDSSQIVLFLLYIGMFLEPIRKLINFNELYQKGVVGFTRYLEIMEIEPQIKDCNNPKDLNEISSSIKFKNVTFKYEEKETVLNNFNLEIEKNKTVALVGPSGVGKTTICSLIPRFYEVTEGEICINGINIKEYKQTSLRNSIGIVQQDVYIFNCSVFDNIAYGKTNATYEEVIEAAKKANIHEFILNLENGYDTKLGERGVKLSGGQKQRISIARVFLKNPPILILDEATASLDNESEKYIQRSIEELSKNRTTIVIAHRLSTIINADKIAYISKNGVEEEGNHKKLLEQNGKYAQLYNMQFLN